jgi:hypothetical protein
MISSNDNFKNFLKETSLFGMQKVISKPVSIPVVFSTESPEVYGNILEMSIMMLIAVFFLHRFEIRVTNLNVTMNISHKIIINW